MAELADLEARIRQLEKEYRQTRDMEAIKRVKYRYWRCLDKKTLDEIADCFTEDAVADYGPKIKLQGRKAIVDFLKDSMPRFVGVHHGHNPEIEVTSGMTAKGIWALYYNIIDVQANTVLRGWGFYEDEYAKEDGEWKIKSSKLIRTFAESWERQGKPGKWSDILGK